MSLSAVKNIEWFTCYVMLKKYLIIGSFTLHIKFPVLHSPLMAAVIHLYPFTKPRISYC